MGAASSARYAQLHELPIGETCDSPSITIQSHKRSKSRLLNLPLKIRNIIWHHAFGNCTRSIHQRTASWKLTSEAEARHDGISTSANVPTNLQRRSPDYHDGFFKNARRDCWHFNLVHIKRLVHWHCVAIGYCLYVYSMMAIPDGGSTIS